MHVNARRLGAAHVMMLASCAGGSGVPTPGEPNTAHTISLSSATPAPLTPAHAPWPRAHYTPYVPPDNRFLDRGVARYIPLESQLRTTLDAAARTSVKLDVGVFGVLDHGGRYRIAAGVATLVRDRNTNDPLLTVRRVSANLGAAFLFETASHLYIAEKFDGPLRLVGKIGESQVLGPSCIFLGRTDHGKQVGELLSLPDARRISTAPLDLAAVWVHSAGFMIGMSNAAAGATYFSKDGRVWSRLAFRDVTTVVEDGASLVLVHYPNTAARVGRDGALGLLTLSDNDLDDLINPNQPYLTPPTEVREGEFIERNWTPTGRFPDEWILAELGKVYVARVSTGALSHFELPEDAHGSCEFSSESASLYLVCFDLKAHHLRVYSPEIDAHRLVLTSDISVTTGNARRWGMTLDESPPTAFVTAACDGDATDAKVCVRGRLGRFQTFALPQPPMGQALIFQGEVLVLATHKDGSIELRHSGERATGRTSYLQARPLYSALTFDPTSSTGQGAEPFFATRWIRTRDGVRGFYVPRSGAEFVGSRFTNFAVDYRLGGGEVRINPVSGSMSSAGLYGLRLDAGKLFETNDGWATWVEVPPPPTGVPDSLDSTFCDRRGCVLGAWTRIGWERPPTE